MSSSVNYSNINSILTRLDHFDDDFMIVEEKNQNLSMHISSYMGSEIQEIHDGSNIKLNDINEQFNSLNMYSKKEQVLDKSLSFQNICVEDKFFNKEVMDSNLGKDNWIDPIAEDGDEDVNESFFHENIFLRLLSLIRKNMFLYFHLIYYIHPNFYRIYIDFWKNLNN